MNYIIAGLLYLAGAAVFAVHNLNTIITLAKDELKEVPVIIIAFIYAFYCSIWPLLLIGQLAVSFLLAIKKKN